MARLKIRDKGEPREVRFEGRVTIGRVESCDVTVQDESCSREHCEVLLENGQWMVRDCGSSNGTALNGTRVEESVLAERDKIRIGATTLEFMAADADAVLRFEDGEQSGEVVPLGDDRVTFGRRANNALSFKDIKVSGVHVEIVREGDEFVLRDLGSTNGTQLDGRKIDEVILGHGDRIQFGEQVCVFEASGGGALSAPASGAKGSKASKAAPVPTEPRSKVRSIVALVVLIGAIGGAAWFSFRPDEQRVLGTKRRAPPPTPSGTLWVDDWSFEEPAEVVRLWDDRGEASLGVRRGGARSGAGCLSAVLDSETPNAEAWRTPGPVTPGQAYAFSGAWDVDEGVAGVLLLRFQAVEEGAEDGESDEDGEIRDWTLIVARSTGSDGWEDLDCVVSTPAWAATVSVGVLAWGDGSLRVDDLAFQSASAGEGHPVGNLVLMDRVQGGTGGGAIALARRMPLLEGFVGSGSHVDDQGRTVDAPVGAIPLRVSRDGAKARIEFGEGSDSFRFLLAPTVALDGLDLMAESGGQRVGGSFSVEGVNAMVVGLAARRFEMRFSRPCHVSGIPDGDSLWVEVTPHADSLEIEFRAEFTELMRQANALLLEAKRDHGQGRLGEALGKLRRIRDELPHDVDALATARQLGAEMSREAERRLTEIETLYTAAKFLDNLPRYQEVLTRAEDLLKDVKGTRVAETLEQTLSEVQGRVQVLSVARLEREAERLKRTAEAFQKFGGREATARRLAEALEKSYADTGAGREGGL